MSDATTAASLAGLKPASGDEFLIVRYAIISRTLPSCLIDLPSTCGSLAESPACGRCAPTFTTYYAIDAINFTPAALRLGTLCARRVLSSVIRAGGRRRACSLPRSPSRFNILRALCGPVLWLSPTVPAGASSRPDRGGLIKNGFASPHGGVLWPRRQLPALLTNGVYLRMRTGESIRRRVFGASDRAP